MITVIALLFGVVLGAAGMYACVSQGVIKIKS